MAAPSTPQNYNIQQGNADVFLSWDIVAGATSYTVQRSIDGVTFSTLASPTTNYYLDTTVTVGTNYYYQVGATNSSGTSTYTAALSIVPSRSADLALGQVRLMSQQRADRVNSQFVTLPEWNSYIVQSYFELYDLLVDVYEDYFVQTPYQFTTTGAQQYTLPTDFYKLLGVDFAGNQNGNAWVTLRKFEFISRNRYIYPQMNVSALGIWNPQYRLVGNTLFFIPTPASGQLVQVWYIPKVTQPLQDTDILSGVSGWIEYVIVDAAIKALQKEESDVTVLMGQKMMLKTRIEESSMNRDAGQPDKISNVRTGAETFGSFGGPGWDGSFGGF